MFSNTSNQVAAVDNSCSMGDIYDVVGAASGAVMASNPLHTYITTHPSFTFNSSGDTAARMNMRSVPFTVSQWQELQRQTLIYNYMMASVPVPTELLIPLTKTLSNLTPSNKNVIKRSLELRISNTNSDPEPWRCRRTDGKKWRCSRDVAPDQKYCERHSHKTRPRSRKLVELPGHFTNTKNKTHQTHNLPSHDQKPHLLTQPDAQFLPNQTLSSASSTYDQPRYLDWFMKGETVSAANNSNREWQKLMQPKVGFSLSCGDNNDEQNQRDQGQLLTSQSRIKNEQNSMLLRPSLEFMGGTLNLNQTLETRHFIDAWSKQDKDVTNIGLIGPKGCVSSRDKIPLSSLSLSMYGGSEINRNGEQENGEMGSYVFMGSERGNKDVGDTMRPQWMNSGSWMGSPPGGPLAEALGLGVATSGTSNSTASHDCSVNSTTACNFSRTSSWLDGGK